MPLKMLRTLLHLYRWSCPDGVRVFYSVSPGGQSVRVVMMAKRDDYIHVFPLSWTCRNYRTWLDDSARILIMGDAADPLAATLADADQTFNDGIKAAVLRKGKRAC